MENTKKINPNIPNYLSFFRFICTPVMVVMFLVAIPYGIGVFVALALYVLGCISDLLDGKIARKYNLISDFGKFIDPIADKFLQTAGLILVLFAGAVETTWLAAVILIIIVLRDIEISGIRQIAASKGIVIAADMYGKVKSVVIDISTITLMIYVGIVQASSSGDAAKLWFVPATIIQLIGITFLIIGTALAVVSCINYTMNAWPKIFKKESNGQKTELTTEQKVLTTSGTLAVAKSKAQAEADKKYAGEKKISTGKIKSKTEKK